MSCRAEHTCDATPAAASAPWASADVGACCGATIKSKGSPADNADRRLLGAISTGSRSALRLLHAEYFTRLVGFFTHLMPSPTPEVVDDLIADTLFDVWRTSSNRGRAAHGRGACCTTAHGTGRDPPGLLRSLAPGGRGHSEYTVRIRRRPCEQLDDRACGSLVAGDSLMTGDNLQRPL